jgi:nucleotide-binding universal stress UspA family protein
LVVVGSRRVIAGVSGSVRSLGALRAGVAEARSSGSTLLAVLAWAPAGGEVAYMRAPCPILLRLWEQDAQERLRGAFDAVFGGVPGGVAVRMMVVRASPGPLLVDLADQPDDLLVVGCGGRSGLSCVVHGSVTRYCLAHARCPVLAVPPPELIAEVRPWRHRWRPDDFAVLLAGPELARGHGADGQPVAGRRAIAAPSEGAGPDGALANPDLPNAYRGAPYYLPRAPTRRQRALRRLRLALMLVAPMLLVIITGILLAHSNGP